MTQTHFYVYVAERPLCREANLTRPQQWSLKDVSSVREDLGIIGFDPEITIYQMTLGFVHVLAVTTRVIFSAEPLSLVGLSLISSPGGDDNG